MLRIRLRPIGKKHQRTFRLSVDERRHKLQGREIEDLGWYNPRTDKFGVKNERVAYWMGQGAKPSDTVHNLLIRARIIKGKKIPLHGVAKKKKGVAPAEATK